MLDFINDNRIQLVSIIGSLSFLFFILELIRKKRISEAYSILWLFMAAIFIALSVWRQGLDLFSELVGVAYPPAALLLVMIMIIIIILVQVSVIISAHTEKIRTLAQELSLLNLENKQLKASIEELKTNKSGNTKS